MRHIPVLLLAALAAPMLASCSATSGGEFTLSCPSPSPEARQLFDTLAANYGRRSLSGTMANVNWNDAEARLVSDATGHWPEVIGLDLIDIALTDSSRASGYNPYADLSVAEDHWRKGGIVSVCWHWSVPAAPDSSRLVFRTDTEFRVDSMFSAGSWENRVMEHDLALVVAQLRRLRDAHIPVLWRPLHEASGNRKSGGTEWFWWGNGGPDSFVRLWRLLYDRFRAEGLDNLIWVWTTQTGYGDDQAMGVLSDRDWYPGDGYVDLIGRDAYGRTAAQMADEFRAIESEFPGKMLILSECGNVGKMSEQWSLGARWGLFIPWYTYKATSLRGHLYADSLWWVDAMSQDFVVKRGDLNLRAD
ncbi:MAG: glycosyl hydrolase [Marinilabiliaceae bacterium]